MVPKWPTSNEKLLSVWSVHDLWIPQLFQKLTLIVFVSSFLSTGGFWFYSYFYLPFCAHTRRADFQASSWKRNWLNVWVALFQRKAFFCQVKCDTDTHQEFVLRGSAQVRTQGFLSLTWVGWGASVSGGWCGGVRLLLQSSCSEHWPAGEAQRRTSESEPSWWCLSELSSLSTFTFCIKENITWFIYNWIFHLPLNRERVILWFFYLHFLNDYNNGSTHQ